MRANPRAPCILDPFPAGQRFGPTTMQRHALRAALQVLPAKGYWDEVAPHLKVVRRPLPPLSPPAVPPPPRQRKQQKVAAAQRADSGASGGAAEAARRGAGNAADTSAHGGAAASGGAQPQPQAQEPRLSPAQRVLQSHHEGARRAEAAVRRHCEANGIDPAERILELDEPSWAPQWLLEGLWPPPLADTSGAPYVRSSS